LVHHWGNEEGSIDQNPDFSIRMALRAVQCNIAHQSWWLMGRYEYFKIDERI